MRHRQFITLMLLSVSLVMASCSSDREPDGAAPTQEVTLRISLPDALSRAGETDDYPVNQRYMDPTDAYLVVYDGAGVITSIIDGQLGGSQGDRIRSLGVRIASSEGATLRCRALINVAQASSVGSNHTDVDTWLKHYIGHTDTELRAALMVDGYSADGVWPLTDTGGFLPMQSELVERDIENSDREVIPVYRSLAKIDVLCSAPDFVLDRVYVVNQHTHGAYISGKSTTMLTGAAHPQFSIPDIPGDPYNTLRSEPVAYTPVYNTTASRYEVTERIFVPEHANKTTDAANPLHIQVEGHFTTGSPVHRYYNLYLTDTGKSNGTAIDVVRNHIYTLNLTRVTLTEHEVTIRVNPNWAVHHIMDIEEED